MILEKEIAGSMERWYSTNKEALEGILTQKEAEEYYIHSINERICATAPDLYNVQHYMHIQMVEINEHKHYLGEKENRNITYEEALKDWRASGHSERFRRAYFLHIEDAEKLASQYEGRTIPNDIVHKTLEDGESNYVEKKYD